MNKSEIDKLRKSYLEASGKIWVALKDKHPTIFDANSQEMIWAYDHILEEVCMCQWDIVTDMSRYTHWKVINEVPTFINPEGV